MTNEKITRLILKIDQDDAAMLNRIAKTLDCSHTKAVQIAIDLAYGIQTTPTINKPTRFNEKVSTLFIPMTDQQKIQKSKIEYSRKATFAFLCREAIRKLHEGIDSFRMTIPSPLTQRYLCTSEELNRTQHKETA